MNSDPLYEAVKEGNLLKIKTIFEKPGKVKLDKLHDGTESLLGAAVRLQHPDVVTFLADKGADVNIKNFSGKTPLHLACFEGNTQIVKTLLSHGAKHDAADQNGKAALHWAVSKNFTEIVKVLVANGADINAQTKEGNTVLHEAIENSSKELVTCLVECGADVRRPNNHREMPLHIATRQNRPAIAELLLKHGADIDDVTDNGETVLHLCCLKGITVMAQHLLGYLKVDQDYVNKQTTGGTYNLQGKPRSVENWTALHISCAEGYDNIVKELLNYGADKNIKTKDGKTARDLAVFYKHQNVVDLFEDPDQGKSSDNPPKGRRASLPTVQNPQKGSSVAQRRNSVAQQKTTSLWRRA